MPKKGQNWSVVKVLLTTSLTTQQKLLSFDLDVLPHPPYSADLAPSDYHLFWSLQNPLNMKTFTDERVVKSHMQKFFDNKLQKFYECSIVSWWKEAKCNQ